MCMKNLTREEFSQIYENQFLPILTPLEQKRKIDKKKSKPFEILCVIFGLSIIITSFLPNTPFPEIRIVSVILLIITIFIAGNVCPGIRDDVKKEVITKILSLFWQFYLTTDKYPITAKTIKEMGLFPSFTDIYCDDVIEGIHKDLNLTISETHLFHSEQIGKHAHIFDDFHGLLLKIQMHKKFTGKTIVGVNHNIRKLKGFEQVNLEDIEFAKNLKVFSTDQIEARYILTTAFMQRLFWLGEFFANNGDAVSNKSNYAAFSQEDLLVSAAFIDGNVYLFVPTKEDFFEISESESILNVDKYYDVYCQIQHILSIVEYMKFDMKLGL